VRNDYLLGRTVQTEKYLRKARSASANERRFSRFLPVLFRTTSATWRGKQIPVGGICSELSHVRNRDYFPYADFWRASLRILPGHNFRLVRHPGKQC
jgi:hypothetical protein